MYIHVYHCLSRSGIDFLLQNVGNYLKLPETKTAIFGNSVILDEVAHYEPPHLDVHCLPFSL